MQTRSEETRTKIILAARDLFSQNGYDATGVAEICDRVGVSKGAFYHHFQSKQELFLALLDEWMAGLSKSFQQINDSAEDAVDGFQRMGVAAGSLYQQNETQLPLLLEFWTQASRHPEVWQKTIEPYRQFQEIFRQMIVSGQQQGVFTERFEPQSAARTMTALAMGMLLMAMFDPEGAAWDKAVSESIQLLLSAMRS